MENNESRIKILIRKNILLFSSLLFVTSTLLLFVLFAIQKTTLSQEIAMWLLVAEEVLKGLLAAAAVTFLYDWILREESAEQVSVAVSRELRKQLSLFKAKLESHVRYDYVFEALLYPLEEGSYSNDIRNRFCRLYIRSRFRSPYLGDTVTFALVRTREQVDQLRRDPNCLFRWQLDTLPSDHLDESFLDVTHFQVLGQIWEKKEAKISNDAVIVTYHRTSPLLNPPIDVLYEFELRTIEVIQGNVVLVDYYSFYTLINPTFRVDARSLGSRNIMADISFEADNVLQGPYIKAPEGAGTWEIYVDGILDPIQTIRFLIFVEDIQPKL